MASFWRAHVLVAGVIAAVATPGHSQILKGLQAPTGAQSPALVNKLGPPAVARLQGDGAGVDLAWYAVNSAVGGYEVLRAEAPGVSPVKVGSVQPGTLGFRDPQPINGPVYYQVVAIGPNGSRAEGPWLLYAPPVVTSATLQGADVVVVWSASTNSRGGYEIWRRAGTNQRPVRVGSVATDQLSFRDTQAGSGPFSYQVIALGTGGTSAASQWFASTDTPTSGRAPARRQSTKKQP
jgi:hypothetical protein